jgi:hypothetical protein
MAASAVTHASNRRSEETKYSINEHCLGFVNCSGGDYVNYSGRRSDAILADAFPVTRVGASVAARM